MWWDWMCVVLGVLAALLLLPLLFARVPALAARYATEFRVRLTQHLYRDEAVGQDVIRAFMYYSVISQDWSFRTLADRCHAIRQVAGSGGPGKIQALELGGQLLAGAASAREWRRQVEGSSSRSADAGTVLRAIVEALGGTWPADPVAQRDIVRSLCRLDQAIELVLAAAEIVRLQEEV